jgi:hypothetical protein
VIEISSSVTRIERTAFVQCTRLISLELLEGLGIIDLGGRLDPHDEEPKPPNGELRNIYACRSLVNLVMSSEQNVEQLDDDEAFMENLKLRHVASNFDDLARNCSIGLMSFPYYQSYYPMQLAVRAMFRIDTNNRAHTNNRALGKTIMPLSNDILKNYYRSAFHVLSAFIC